MGYKREIAIKLDLDEIRIIDGALRKYKTSLKDGFEKSTTKTGRAKKGEIKSKEFYYKQIKKTDKLIEFFIGLF